MAKHMTLLLLVVSLLVATSYNQVHGLGQQGMPCWDILFRMTSHSHIYAFYPGSRKLMQNSARSDAFSWSTPSSWWPMPFRQPPSAAAQAASEASVDQGDAMTGAETTTNTPEYFLNCICKFASKPTTAEALSKAFAAGKDSAEAKAATKAVALASDACCLNLGIALANAKSYAESIGQGNAFVTSASKAESEATSLCGKSAIAQSLAESRAANDQSVAEAKAQAQASGPSAKTSTQTKTSVGPGTSSSSSFSFATSG